MIENRYVGARYVGAVQRSLGGFSGRVRGTMKAVPALALALERTMAGPVQATRAIT